MKPRLDTLLGVAKTPRLPFEKSGPGHRSISRRACGSLKEFSETFGIATYTPPGKAWMRGWMDPRVRSAGARRAQHSAEARGGRGPGQRSTRQGPEIRLVRQMRFHLNGLRHMIGRELAPAAELSIGFNELDGD